MLRAVVTHSGGSLVEVTLLVPSAEEGEEHSFDPNECKFKPEEGATECGEGPSPIVPEMKELAWGAGSFIVFALLMRFFLYPRLKAGMDARYASIRDGHESADAARAAARAEVADYESAIAGVKAEAAARVDAARLVLDEERNAALAEVNARIATKREAAAAAAEADREAVRGQIEGAVADVASRAVELAVGKRPDAAVVSQAVSESMSAGVR